MPILKVNVANIFRYDEYFFEITNIFRRNKRVPGQPFTNRVQESPDDQPRMSTSPLFVFLVSGHLNCTDHLTPLSHRQDPSLLPPAWNWDKFAVQNERAKGFVGDYGALYMDVDTMTALRADGHLGTNLAGITDCLHYCNPGPMDTWVRMLHNILRQALPPHPDLPPRKKRRREGRRGAKEVGVEGIRGSKIGSAEGARRVREEMQRISSEGKWRMTQPRVLPWPKAPVGAIEGCDKEHGKKGGAGAVFGADADAIARKTKRGPEEWNVRRAAKYEWGIKKGGEGRLELFNSTKMCRWGLGRLGGWGVGGWGV